MSKNKQPVAFIHDPRFATVMKKLKKSFSQYSWCLIGGRATEVWKNPPQTPDIDILFDVPPNFDDGFDAYSSAGVVVLLNRIHRSGFSFARPAKVSEEGDAIYHLIDDETHVEVDLLTALDDLHREILREAPIVTVGRIKFPVATREHVIVLKAQAAVDRGRPIDKKSRDRIAIRDLSVGASKPTLRLVLEQHELGEEEALLKFLRVL